MTGETGKRPVAARETRAVSGSATGLPGFPWATQERHLHGMSLVEPGGGARGQHSRRKLEVGTAFLWLRKEPLGQVQSSRSVRSNSATPWTAARQASLPITNSQSLLKLISIESMMPSNHLIPFSNLQSFPAPGSFQMSQCFASGGQSIGLFRTDFL